MRLRKEYMRMAQWMTLISSMMKIGMIGFGGGNALIPIISKKAVQEEKFLSREEYEKDIVVASITPGALPVELASGIGRRVAGSKGMFIGAFAMACPGVLMTLALLSGMDQINPDVLRQISFLALGITAFIACLLSEYILDTFRAAREQDNLWEAWLIMGIVLLLTCEKNLYRILDLSWSPMFSLPTSCIFAMAFFGICFTKGHFASWRGVLAAVICVLYIGCVGKARWITNSGICDAVEISMVVLSFWGAWDSLKIDTLTERLRLRESVFDLRWFAATMLGAFGVACWIVPFDALWLYVENGILSSLMSFGGGDAYLTVADGLFVATGLITEDEFYSRIVPVVNILPGSILCKTLSGIGYSIGAQTGGILLGWVTAMAGFMASLLASCGIFSIIGSIYGSVEQLEIFRLIRRWIRPIVSGLMLTVILSLVWQNCKLGDVMGKRELMVGALIVFYAAGMFLSHWRSVKSSRIVVLLATFAMIFCNMVK